MNICNTKNKFNFKLFKKDLLKISNNLKSFLFSITKIPSIIKTTIFSILFSIKDFFKINIEELKYHLNEMFFITFIFSFGMFISSFIFITLLFAVVKIIDFFITVKYYETSIFSFNITPEMFSIFANISLLLYVLYFFYVAEEKVCKRYF